MGMMVIDNKFNLEEIVYLKTDPAQLERIVVSITIGFGGAIRYMLCCGAQESWHYEVEISEEKNVLISD